MTQLKTLSVTCPTVSTPTPVLTTITIAGCSSPISIGGTCVLTTTGKDQYGNDYPTNDLFWGSMNGSIASVASANASSSMTITGKGAGTVSITCANSTGRSATISITVIAPANITCTSAPNPTNPSLTEIDINYIWTNTGGTSGSFTPAVSINGGAAINLTTGPITLAPGATYNAVKALTGLTLTPGTTYTVCPVPN